MYPIGIYSTVGLSNSRSGRGLLVGPQRKHARAGEDRRGGILAGPQSSGLGEYLVNLVSFIQ